MTYVHLTLMLQVWTAPDTHSWYIAAWQLQGKIVAVVYWSSYMQEQG